MILYYFLLRSLRWLLVLSRSFQSIGLVALLIIVGCACNRQDQQTNVGLALDSTLTLSYAQGFQLDYYEDVKVLSLISKADTTRYLLLSDEEQPPNDLEFDQTIRVPVQRVISQSTTHLAFLTRLDAIDRVVGLDKASYVFDTLYTERFESGLIQEVGSGNSLNAERVVSLNPDLILVSYMPGGDLSAYQKFIRVGIPVLPIAEWTEQHPLGKAEWIKLFSALLGKETLAREVFDKTQESYENLAQLVQKEEDNPELIVGSPFQGTWYVPGAESYRNALIQDAGGNWAFGQDSTAVSFPIAFERMYGLGVQADIWLDPGQAETIENLLTIDERFSDFNSINSGKVYNSNRRVNAAGTGNDYYESGVVYPQRVLADLIKIFHPELLPHHQLYYYQQLP